MDNTLLGKPVTVVETDADLINVLYCDRCSEPDATPYESWKGQLILCDECTLTARMEE